MGFNEKDEIANLCSQMMHELQGVYDPDKVKVRLTVVSREPRGVVVAEAKKTQSNWVIMDKRLKHEKKSRLDELHYGWIESESASLELDQIATTEFPRLSCDEWDSSPKESTTRGPLVTPASSTNHESPVAMTDIGTSSISSSEPGNSPYLLSEVQKKLNKQFTDI